MLISREEVKKIAQLARLKLTSAEEKRHTETISVVLDYMKILNEVDTTDVPETCQVTGLENVTREDKAEDCDQEIKEKLVNIFPNKTGKLLKVKAVFENEDAS